MIQIKVTLRMSAGSRSMGRWVLNTRGEGARRISKHLIKSFQRLVWINTHKIMLLPLICFVLAYFSSSPVQFKGGSRIMERVHEVW